MMVALKPFVSLCGQAAPIASMAVFMAPFPTIQKVRREQTVGDLPLLPYSSMAASAFLWGTYGVLKNEPSVYTSNFLGLAFALYYFFQFVKFSPRSAPTLPGSVRGHVMVSGGIAAAAALLYMSGLAVSTHIIGLAAMTLCLALFGSPLAALKTVIRTKSSKTIPLPFVIASVVNCFSWFIYGLFGMKDPNIYLTNFVGLTFALLQLGFKVKYNERVKLAPLAAM